MSLDEDYAVGMSRADENLAESRIALAQHQAALDLEQELVHKFFEDLVIQLPMAEIEKHDIYRDDTNWTQLMFVHHKASTLTSIASLKFETSQHQFIYADFMSNFERRLPLPPNHNSFDVIAKYLGQSVRWWTMSEDDRRIQREVDKGLRKTLGSLSPFTEPD
jgi:hypothetical protein